MKTQIIVGTAVCAIVLSGGSFFGGMQYEKSHLPNGVVAGAFSGRGGIGGEFPGGMPGGTRAKTGGMGGAGFIAGEVLAIDDQSVTIKLPDGGSKIVYYSDSTQIMKSDAGTKTDLTVGAQVTTTGTANADGTSTAQSIQIRPATIK